MREISPSVDPITRTFAVRVTIVDPDAALHWGMTANVVLMSGDASDAVLLPLSSIYRKGDAAAVWIYDEKARIVRLRPIAVAQYREDGAVVNGVTSGEWIVTAGVQKLREGETVRPYEAGANRASSTSGVIANASIKSSKDKYRLQMPLLPRSTFRRIACERELSLGRYADATSASQHSACV